MRAASASGQSCGSPLPVARKFVGRRPAAARTNPSAARPGHIGSLARVFIEPAPASPSAACDLHPHSTGTDAHAYSFPDRDCIANAVKAVDQRGRRRPARTRCARCRASNPMSSASDSAWAQDRARAAATNRSVGETAAARAAGVAVDRGAERRSTGPAARRSVRPIRSACWRTVAFLNARRSRAYTAESRTRRRRGGRMSSTSQSRAQKFSRRSPAHSSEVRRTRHGKSQRTALPRARARAPRQYTRAPESSVEMRRSREQSPSFPTASQALVALKLVGFDLRVRPRIQLPERRRVGGQRRLRRAADLTPGAVGLPRRRQPSFATTRAIVCWARPSYPTSTICAADSFSPTRAF